MTETWLLPLLSIPMLSAPTVYFWHERWHLSARTLSLGILAGFWAIVLSGRVYSITTQVGSIPLTVDGLSQFFILFALSGLTLVILYSTEHEPRYYALLWLMTGAVMGMVSAGDLFQLWLWFEVMVFASYGLVAFNPKSHAVQEATLKYIVQSAIGSILVLFGIELVLAVTGSLAFRHLRDANLDNPTLAVAGVFFVVGFGIKTALFPLHTWLPEVYAHAPTPVTAYLASVITVSGIAALLRSLAVVANPASDWGAWLMACGLVNIIAGNALAYPQTDVKRLLAYSSLTHIGYILLGIGIGLHTGTSAGIQAGLYHLLNHALMKGIAFLVLGVWLVNIGADSQRVNREDLGGLVYRTPWLGASLALALLSLAGVPPTAGFMSKAQIFLAGLASADPWVLGAVVIAALNVLVSFAYYLPLLTILFKPTTATPLYVPRRMSITLGILTLVLLIVSLQPDSVRWLTYPAAQDILRNFGG